MAYLKRGEGALPDERGLHGHLVGPELVQEREEAVVDGEETVAERKGGARGDHARALVMDAGSVEEEKAKTGDPAPGIDPENPDRAGAHLRRYDGRGRLDGLSTTPGPTRASRGGPS